MRTSQISVIGFKYPTKDKMDRFKIFQSEVVLCVPGKHYHLCRIHANTTHASVKFILELQIISTERYARLTLV